MRHEEARNLLIYFAGKELKSSDQREDVATHIQQCPECENELLQIQNVLAVVDTQRIKNNPFFYEKLKQRMGASTLQKNVFQWEWKPSFAIASIFLGVTVGILFGNFVDSQPLEQDNNVELALEEIYLDEYISQAELMIEQ